MTSDDALSAPGLPASGLVYARVRTARGETCTADAGRLLMASVWRPGPSGLT